MLPLTDETGATYSQFPMDSPFIAVGKKSLIGVCVMKKISHDNVVRTGRVDVCSLLHQIGCRPCVIDKNRWNSTNPNRDERIIIVLTPLLERDPWFAFRKVKMIADYGKWKWARRKLPSQQEDSGVVGENDNERETDKAGERCRDAVEVEH